MGSRPGKNGSALGLGPCGEGLRGFESHPPHQYQPSPPAEDLIMRTDQKLLHRRYPSCEVTLIAALHNRISVSINNDPSFDSTSNDHTDPPPQLSHPTLKGPASPSHGRTIVHHHEHATPPPGKSHQSPFYQHHS